MVDEPEPHGRDTRNWWLTLPGALTAVAGLITAVTGLIVAVNQLGLVGSDDESASPSVVSATSVPKTTVPETTETGGGGAAFRVSFPQGTLATVDDNAYKIVGTSVTRRNPGELTLALAIRMTNNGPYDANFWASSFRLLVDGVARAPIDDLNEVVHGKSSGDGAVTFVVPESARDLVLVVGGEVRLPIELRPA